MFGLKSEILCACFNLNLACKNKNLNKKLRTQLSRDSSICEGMGEGCCTQPYPCICKEAVSGFEPMTNKNLNPLIKLFCLKNIFPSDF